MQLRIEAERTLGEVQEDFNLEFPFLKLGFFSKAHKAFKSSNAKFLLTDKATTMREICDEGRADGLLFLDGSMPTWQVERLFEEEFGLHVQVFRKSGSQWLETSRTDNLTLDQQMAKAKDNDWQQVPINEPMDYREQD